MSTFSTSSRQKKAQNPQFFTLLTSKCASRHNGVHFFDTFSTSELQKVVRDRQSLTLLTSKCASRHNGVHFFDISTSKSGPKLVCFVHFDLEMCFAPQRRALFRHLNFQKWSDIGVFCTFWLGNVLRATTACTFSTSQRTKVVQTWCVLYIFTWKCASRHNGVHFLISHLASCLRTRRFSEPTFRPSGATNHWKNIVNRDFPTFSRICIFFLLIFSLLTLLTSAFQLSILSEVSLLNFLRSSEFILRLVTARATTTPLNSWTRVIMNINYWNHIESMAVVDGTQQIFPKNILSLFDFLNLRPVTRIYIYNYINISLHTCCNWAHKPFQFHMLDTFGGTMGRPQML